MKRRIKPGSRQMLDHCGATGKVRFRSDRADGSVVALRPASGGGE